MPVHRGAAAAVVAGVLALAACDSGAGPSTPSPSIAQSCSLSPKLVPACGVLWGIATRPQTLDAVKAVEQQVGRTFDVVYQYHDIDDAIPTASESSEVDAGQILHLAIAARLYESPTTEVTYADIAAGRYDAGLRRQAAGVASIPAPVFVTFEQEANQHSKLGPRGTAAQFRQAWRHVHDIYVEAGATNAVWVWVMTGAPENLSRAGALWPGNDVVDWISWNVYNQSGCGADAIDPALYQSFETGLKPFYTWVHDKGPALGIDPGKPMMISETGSVLYADDAQKTAGWYAGIPATLSKYPQLKGVTLWDSKTSDACDYRFQRDPAVLMSVADAGLDPVIRPAPSGTGGASSSTP